MAKFHISKDGVPRPCSADEGKCPLGNNEPHYGTVVAARAAYEAQQEVNLLVPVRRGVPAPIDEKETPQSELETVVPDPEYHYVGRGAKAKELKAGDRIPVPGNLYRVRSIKLGYKNATIDVVDDEGKNKTVVYGVNDQLSIEVREETPESKTLRNAATKEAYLEKSLVNYKPKRARAAARVLSNIQKGYRMDSSDLRSLTEAEAEDAVVSIYEDRVRSVKKAIAEGNPEVAGATNPYTLAYESVKEDFTREAISQARRGESNSTSAFSNAFEQEMLAAKMNFMERGFFYL